MTNTQSDDIKAAVDLLPATYKHIETYGDCEDMTRLLQKVAGMTHMMNREELETYRKYSNLTAEKSKQLKPTSDWVQENTSVTVSEGVNIMRKIDEMAESGWEYLGGRGKSGGGGMVLEFCRKVNRDTGEPQNAQAQD